MLSPPAVMAFTTLILFRALTPIMDTDDRAENIQSQLSTYCTLVMHGLKLGKKQDATIFGFPVGMFIEQSKCMKTN